MCCLYDIDHIIFLLTEREVCTERYFAEVFCTVQGALPKTVQR